MQKAKNFSNFNVADTYKPLQNIAFQEQIFIALIKGKLIEDRASANYSRCGRTDKGVSAFGQV